MELVIFNNYGGRVPDVLRDKIIPGLEFPQNRFNCSLIEYIKNNSVDFIPNVHTDNWFKLHKDALVRVECKENGKGKYVGFASDGIGGSIACVSIVDVDISRRWTMSEYDGVEIIKYLDDYELRFEDINYWVRREK